MRLFIAVNFGRETVEKIMAVQERLRMFGTGNFSRPENLHLTLAFLGEVAPRRAADVKMAMDLTGGGKAALIFDRAGNFRRDGGDIWFIGLRENAVLEKLHRSLTANLAASGFPSEERRLTPHITIARQVILHTACDGGKLLGTPFSAQADAMSLMLSERINGRLIYTQLHRRILEPEKKA